MSEGLETALKDITNTLQNFDNKLDRIISKVFSEKSYSNKPPVDKDATYINKRKTYLSKLNNGEIREPKPSTLEYYEIVKDGNIYEVKKD